MKPETLDVKTEGSKLAEFVPEGNNLSGPIAVAQTLHFKKSLALANKLIGNLKVKLDEIRRASSSGKINESAKVVLQLDVLLEKDWQFCHQLRFEAFISCLPFNSEVLKSILIFVIYTFTVLIHHVARKTHGTHIRNF